MQKKLIRRIAASLILSVMLFALPVGAFIANSSNAVTAYADDEVSGNESDGNTDPDDGTGDTEGGETLDNETGGTGDEGGNGDETENGDEEGGGDETGEEGDDPTPTPEPTPEPEPEPECICDHKCSQYDYNKECPVCSENYKDCEYKEPSVKITINAPSSWYSSGSSAKITFKVEDILDTGNFAIKSVRAEWKLSGCYRGYVYRDIRELYGICSRDRCQ